MDVGLKLCVVFLLMAFAETTTTEQPTTAPNPAETTTTEQPTTAPNPGVLLVGLRDTSPIIYLNESDRSTGRHPGPISYLDLSDPSSGLHQLFTTIRWGAHDIDYDPVDAMVYWTESTTIHRSHPDGSGHQLIYETADTLIPDICLDVDGRYIYWVDGTSTIYRSPLNGSGLEPAAHVVAPSDQTIDSITIDTVHRQIYWHTWNSPGGWSSAMDGSQVVNIVADPVYQYGASLEIDVTRERLYWVGASFDGGMRCFMAESQTDGQGYQVLVNTTIWTNDVTLDQDSGVLYWKPRWDIYQITPHDPSSTSQLVYGADRNAIKTIEGIHHVPADAASAIIDV